MHKARVHVQMKRNRCSLEIACVLTEMLFWEDEAFGESVPTWIINVRRSREERCHGDARVRLIR